MVFVGSYSGIRGCSDLEHTHDTDTKEGIIYISLHKVADDEVANEYRRWGACNNSNSNRHSGLWLYSSRDCFCAVGYLCGPFNTNQDTRVSRKAYLDWQRDRKSVV